MVQGQLWQIVCETPPTPFQTNQSKMNWRCGSSGRAPALQVWPGASPFPLSPMCSIKPSLATFCSFRELSSVWPGITEAWEKLASLGWEQAKSKLGALRFSHQVEQRLVSLACHVFMFFGPKVKRTGFGTRCLGLSSAVTHRPSPNPSFCICEVGLLLQGHYEGQMEEIRKAPESHSKHCPNAKWCHRQRASEMLNNRLGLGTQLRVTFCPVLHSPTLACSPSSFFPSGTGVWTQGLTLPRQTLYTPSPFCL
jgi:hypothetical protein